MGQALCIGGASVRWNVKIIVNEAKRTGGRPEVIKLEAVNDSC